MKVAMLLCPLHSVVMYLGRTFPGDNREMLRLKWVEVDGREKKPREGKHFTDRISLSTQNNPECLSGGH